MAGDVEPCSNLPWLKVVGNVGDAHTSGVEAQLAWIPAEGWDIGANAQWLEAEVDNDFETNPRSPAEATLIRKGDPLPNVPDLQGSLWVTDIPEELHKR